MDFLWSYLISVIIITCLWAQKREGPNSWKIIPLYSFLVPARLSGMILIWGFGLCGKKLYSSIMEKCGNYNERNFYVFDKNYDIPEEVSSVKNSELEYFIKQHKNMLTVIISVQNSSVQKDIAESLTQQYGLSMESILFYRNIKR